VTGTDPSSTIDHHRVVFAGDVPGERLALVMGRTTSLLSYTWFTGPIGATPAEMQPAMTPQRTLPDQPVTSVDVPDPASATAVLVVVGRPGDTVEYTTGRVLDADGAERQEERRLTLTDGAGPHRGRRPAGAAGAGRRVLAAEPAAHRPGLLRLWRRRCTRGPAGRRRWPAGGPARGPGRLHLPLRRDRHLGRAPRDGRRREQHRGDDEHRTRARRPAAAGQTLTVRVGGPLAVSAPAGATSATVLASDGTTITTVPSVAGSRTPDLRPAPAPVATRIRVQDAAGAVVAEAPVTGTAG
jgi:hypothetical protein